MTMAENELPKLTRKASKARLHNTASRLSIDAKVKNEHHASEKDKQTDSNKDLHADKIKDKDAKKTKKGKKKDKGRHEIKDDRTETELKTFWSRGERATAKRESFRNCVFEKVKAALNIAYKDGATHIDIDNVTPLMKTLNISTASENFVDLIRHAIIENSCQIVPQELDALIVTTQEDNLFVDVDECLEAAFNLIDLDNDGFITQKDIRLLMHVLGEQLGEVAANDMLQVVDTDKDGQISLSEFRHFLLGRDLPLREEAENKAETIKELREVKKTVKNETDSQAVKEDGLNNEGSNMADKNTDSAYGKIRSVVNGLKHIPSTQRPAALSGIDLTAVRDQSLRSHSASIKEEQQDGDTNVNKEADGNESEMMYSPRRLESVNRKQLFFGGFINNDRHFQPVPNQWLFNIEKNDNSGEVEIRRDSVDGITEEKMKMESRRSSFVVFPEVNKVLNSDNPNTICDESSMDDEFTEDIDDYNEDGIWEEGPMPLELDNETSHLPAPDLSLFDIPRSKDESLPVISKLQEPRHDKTEDCMAVSDVVEPEIVSEKVTMSRPRIEPQNMNQIHAEDLHRDSGSMLDGRHIRGTRDDGRDFNQGSIFELRSGRKSSSVLQNSSKTNSEDSEKSGSVPNDDKELTESDEGIELIDDKVVRRALRVSLSPKSSSAPLRTQLPQGDTRHRNNLLENKTSNNHKNRSQITIDLKDLTLNNEENKKENRTLNGNSRINSLVSRNTPKRETQYKHSGENFRIHFPKVNDSSSENEEDEDFRRQLSRLVDSPESSTTIFSTRSNESVCDSDNDSFTLLIKDKKYHNWNTTEETALTQKQVQDSRNENCSQKPHNNPQITSPPQRKLEPSRTMTFNLKYQKVDAGKLEDNSIKISQEIYHTLKAGMASKDGYQIPVAGRRNGDDKNVSDVFYNNPRQGRFPSRVHADRLNPVLHWENSKYVHTTSHNTPKLSELTKYGKPFPQDNKIFAHREQIVTIPDSSAKLTTRRSLQRSRTSFELPVIRDSEASPKTSIADAAKPPPRKRSFSASASRHTATAVTTKPQYTSISVLDLTKSLQTDVSINKNKNYALINTHYEMSNMIPLSKILNSSQANRYGYNSKLDYAVSRNIDKSGVPYFLHSSKVTKVLPPDTKTHPKKRRTKNTPKRLEVHDDLYNSDVTTLVGDYKDPDVIPNDVIFDNVNAINGHIYRR